MPRRRDLRRHLSGKAGRRRSRARRIGEYVHVGKIHRPDKFQRRLEFAFPLPRKSRDHVRSHMQLRKHCPGGRHKLSVLFAHIMTVHRLQYRIVAVLKRKMEKTAELIAALAQTVQQRQIVRMRLGRAQPDSEVAVNRADFAHQPSKIPPFRLVGAGVHPGKHDLRHTGGDQMAAFVQHLVHPARPLAAADVRHNAVGAEIIAPLLDFYQRPMTERKIPLGVF